MADYDPMALMGGPQQAMTPAQMQAAQKMQGLNAWTLANQNPQQAAQYQAMMPPFEGYNPNASNPQVQALIAALMGK
jgi:hypothetical protein